jgi:hypothetical protein
MTYDHIAVAKGERPQGLRSKSAKRRRDDRRRRHASQEAENRRLRDKAERARQKRREDGWWPPKPLTGPPEVYVAPTFTREKP